MTIDTMLFEALGPVVDGRAYPDVAPANAALPRIVHQQVGGVAPNYQEGTLPDQENSRVQVATWATTRTEATAVAKLAETALLAHPVLQVTRLGGRVSVHEEETNLYGARQDFSVWAPR